MKKPEIKVIDGCRNCPWAVGANNDYGPQLCNLSRDLLDISLALTWKGGLADTLGGGEEYPKLCPLAVNQRPVTVVLRDTKYSTEKIGRPVKGHRGHGSRNIEAEARHLRDCWRAVNDTAASCPPLLANVADVARTYGLHVGHLRAAVRGSRPWQLKEVDAVAAYSRSQWHYDREREPATYSAKAKLAQAGA